MAIVFLLCFSFLFAPIFTQSAKAQTGNKIASLDWNGDLANAVVKQPNAFGQVAVGFTPSITCTLTSFSFYEQCSGTGHVQLSSTNGPTGAIGSIVSYTGLTDSNWQNDLVTIDFSSQNIVLVQGITYYAYIQLPNYPPAMLFATTTSGNTYSVYASGGVTNDAFFDAYGTPYGQASPTPTPYQAPTATPFNNPTPTPTIYQNPTSTPIYNFPTPTPQVTYVLGYGFTNTDFIVIILASAIICCCGAYVGWAINNSNKPRRKHK